MLTDWFIIIFWSKNKVRMHKIQNLDVINVN